MLPESLGSNPGLRFTSVDLENLLSKHNPRDLRIPEAPANLSATEDSDSRAAGIARIPERNDLLLRWTTPDAIPRGFPMGPDSTAIKNYMSRHTRQLGRLAANKFIKIPKHSNYLTWDSQLREPIIYTVVEKVPGKRVSPETKNAHEQATLIELGYAQLAYISAPASKEEHLGDIISPEQYTSGRGLWLHDIGPSIARDQHYAIGEIMSWVEEMRVTNERQSLLDTLEKAHEKL